MPFSITAVVRVRALRTFRPTIGSTKTLIAEVTAAGFRLAGEANFLRNPSDTRDWNDSPREAGARRGTSDRFALKFVKD